MSAVTKSQSKTFLGTLERFQKSGLNWVIARIPFSVEKLWGTRGSLKVTVEVNRFQYRTSLFPTGTGQHYLLVNKKMVKAAGVKSDGTIKFTITPDLSPRELKVPEELEKALQQDRMLRKWFDGVNYSIKKWLSDLVADAKSVETRRKRAERVAEQMLEAMEAEHELPPMIQLAFNRSPGAEQGWHKMTATQRRGHLLGIFYYRTPQSRMRRLQKVIDEAVALAEKTSSRF